MKGVRLSNPDTVALRPVPQGRRAYSLIEMLVTLALILIVFVMLYGFGSKSNQMRQKRACEKNLQTIFVSLEIYARENAMFPLLDKATSSEPPLAMLIPKYTSVTEPFICPGSKDKPLPEGESFHERKISYAYYMGRRPTDSAEVLMSDAQIDTKPKIAGQPIFSQNGKSPGNNHHKYGGNFLFCDGHTDSSGTTAPFSIVATQGVALLNPRQP
jgi:prepilin-type N-terminal cleavage/methylation domain-containing protein/prepilin-type processing-associated H-X9-DG protein